MCSPQASRQTVRLYVIHIQHTTCNTCTAQVRQTMQMTHSKGAHVFALLPGPLKLILSCRENSAAAESPFLGSGT